MSVCYRIVTPSEWASMREVGTYPGSPLDIKDGFLHMSAASEVAGTAALLPEQTSPC